MRFALATAASLVASASAHATFQQLWINGVDAGSSCARLPLSNSPVTSVTSNDIACNAAGSSLGVCSVNAGDTVTVEMHQQNGDRSCANEAIGGAHHGPLTVYMAPVSDAKTAVGSSASWFKVSEIGLMSDNPAYWADQFLNINCGHYSFKVPSDIAPGNYLIRAEMIALHAASGVGGAQFYPACFQVNVAGSGSAKPPTVKFPGAYGASDPGILINIYAALSTYQIPGPTPYGTTSPAVASTPYPNTATWNTALQPTTVPTVVPGAPGTTAAGTTTPVASTTSTRTTTTVSTTSTRATPTSSTPTSTPTAVGSVALYGQCGGIGYTGPTTCAQGTCKVTNAYYSQCLN
ncbi:glycoside hydrolase family 61 protein H [Crucibulum laeve]|uniref:AA9 family lytic polysaccharide monooxygenase n=1 Tax=Crucibulum laeve TaxID=68775 RepID=A0A5C3LW57_9AGAR|nr:glycoside hydrolase family 61 protein H [Crucibulum laeve]